MKVKTPEGIRDYKTVWMRDSKVYLIDQMALPHTLKIFESDKFWKTTAAIKDMLVRGAPAIGATAAFGMSQAADEYSCKDLKGFFKHMALAEELMKSTRPTAYDLFYAVDYVHEKIKKSPSVEEARRIAYKESQTYAKTSIETCRKIGLAGEKLIKNGCNILTHCNAGALGCVDYGTAIAPITFAHRKGKKIHVFVDETRPRLQGAKLTAWELNQEDIPYSIIADNAAGYFMMKGEVDLVIVGADRIARNGDVFNKIGTYEKAVLAKENSIPFYVAAPSTTFDQKMKKGDLKIIEERPEDEVLFIDGVSIAPKGSKARNPSFDMTPARYITGVITEKGIKLYKK
jgi:S-methyl-5-thioribose-1-phosphate isomerase